MPGIGECGVAFMAEVARQAMAIGYSYFLLTSATVIALLLVLLPKTKSAGRSVVDVSPTVLVWRF